MENRSAWTPVSSNPIINQSTGSSVKRRRPWSLRLIFVILASITILLAMSGLATWTLRTQRTETDWVLHTEQVR